MYFFSLAVLCQAVKCEFILSRDPLQYSYLISMRPTRFRRLHTSTALLFYAKLLALSVGHGHGLLFKLQSAGIF